jgi:hypothetical protein
MVPEGKPVVMEKKDVSLSFLEKITRSGGVSPQYSPSRG